LEPNIHAESRYQTIRLNKRLQLPAPLGRVVGDEIQCGYHGLCFDRDGQCVRVPGQDQVPARARVRKYPLIERHSFAWIWLGEPALADPARVPDFHWMDDPAWRTVPGYHHFGANYQLVNDNLLDLSHESFVHEETIGNESVAESPASVTLEASIVRVHRDMLNIEAPPFYQRTTGFTGRINRWHTNNFAPPGFHVIENGSMPAGTRDKAQALERKVLNLITPETTTSSHYFWGIARESYIGFAYNKKLLAKNAVPKNYDGLLHPDGMHNWSADKVRKAQAAFDWMRPFFAHRRPGSIVPSGAWHHSIECNEAFNGKGRAFAFYPLH